MTTIRPMRPISLLCCVLALCLFSMACPSQPPLTISVDDETISISAVLVEDGVVVENRSTVPVVVFVESAEGRQQFELEVGESVTVSGLTKPAKAKVVAL